jgi:hypothetical protein
VKCVESIRHERSLFGDRCFIKDHTFNPRFGHISGRFNNDLQAAATCEGYFIFEAELVPQKRVVAA